MLEFQEANGFGSQAASSWQQLSYGDDLVTNLGIQKSLVDEFGGDVKIILGYEDGKLQGMLPLWKYGGQWTFIGNDEVAPYNDFLVKERHLEEFKAQAPKGTRLSNIHWRHPQGRGMETCILAQLPASFIDYFSLLKPKIRQNLRRVYRKNQFTQVFYNRIDDLGKFGRLERNINFKTREQFDVMSPREEARAYGIFVSEALKKGLLRMLSFEIGGRLAAVNVSFQSSIPARGGKRHKIVYDQLCLRKPGFETSFLGIYAIAKNIEWAIQEGVKYYDLGQGTYPYKMAWNVRPKKCRVWTNDSGT
ncbi:MAG: GNAT family N-acetyltransferase [Candidatus Micrarchaeota archaeon]